jgi:hypothetical protein
LRESRNRMRREACRATPLLVASYKFYHAPANPENTTIKWYMRFEIVNLLVVVSIPNHPESADQSEPNLSAAIPAVPSVA